jgi:excinuclease ABC subunit C
VGKAKNLFSRTHQYFSDNVSTKTEALVKNIHDIEYIVTKTDNEALILESNLIKKYQPKYNILLKENNNYPYIIVTNEKNPRIIYTRNYKAYKGKYYGPLASSNFNKYDIYNLLQQIFPLRKCSVLPKQKCLYYDIGECLGPCINDVTNLQYDDIKKQINDFFRGKTSHIIDSLKRDEKKFAQELNFEKAQKTLDLINNIKAITSNNKTEVMLASKNKIDVIGFYTKEKYISIIIHTYQDGKLLAVNRQISELHDDINDALVSYLTQYYLNDLNLPKIAYANISEEHIKALTKVTGFKIVNPASGKFKQIIKSAAINAKEYFSSNYLVYERKREQNELAFDELRKLLFIDNLSIINVFDMSNFFGNDKIGAMIGLENGKLNKNMYRKFIIKDKNLKGDTEYMKEVINRQYTKIIKESSPLPNLIIVDGGIAQVNAAISALKDLGLDKIIPVIGLSKDSKHKTDGIVIANKKISLDKKSGLYMYLFNIQEEVHRFAINFFRNRNKKSVFNNKLNEIKGLGEKTIKKLLSVYGNIEEIKKATIEELSQYVSKDMAIKIKNQI